MTGPCPTSWRTSKLGCAPMVVYRLSRRADDDLDAIYEYTTVNFGSEQARSYLIGLHDRFEELAALPALGS